MVTLQLCRAKDSDKSDMFKFWREQNSAERRIFVKNEGLSRRNEIRMKYLFKRQSSALDLVFSPSGRSLSESELRRLQQSPKLSGYRSCKFGKLGDKELHGESDTVEDSCSGMMSPGSMDAAYVQVAAQESEYFCTCPPMPGVCSVAAPSGKGSHLVSSTVQIRSGSNARRR